MAFFWTGCGDSPTDVDPDPTAPADLSGLPGSIVFLSDREWGATSLGPSLTELYVIRPDGTEERQLTDNETIDNIAALTSVHPSGRSVLFERLMRTGPVPALDAVSVDLDGTLTALTDNLERLIEDQVPPFEWATDPQWSPDGSSFLSAVMGGDQGRTDWEIYVYSADGGERTFLLPENTNLDWKPRWSPRGDWVAFLSADWNSPWKVHLVRPDGSDERLISVPGSSGVPVWAPDGSHVLFEVSARYPEEGPYSIWRVDAEGSGAAVLVQSAPGWRDPILPRFSPDGALLTFVARGPFDTEDIFLAAPDGSDIRSLVSSQGDDRSVAFSPDGDYIVFSSDRFGPQDLFVASVDGTVLERITDTGYNRNPLWLPQR